MTNPQSEVKKCSCKNPFEIPEGIFGFIGEGKCSRCGLPILPTVKESPVSQSVEGWLERGYRIAPTKIEDLDMDYEENAKAELERRWTITILKEEADLFISTTLSTLVKEMEGLSMDGINIYDTCVEHNFVGAECKECEGFNAGISAAIEVVKKMGV